MKKSELKRYLNSSQEYSNSWLSYVDMLFLLVVHIFALYMIASLLINDAKTKNVDDKSDILITITWPDRRAEDVDLWLKLPDDSTIWYTVRENAFAGLERDDRGLVNDYVIQDGREVPIFLNKEVIRIRKRTEGKYVVNVHLYAKHVNLDASVTTTEFPVKIVMEQINPSFKVLAVNEVTLTTEKEERTAFSFEVNSEGDVENISTTEELFINESLSRQSQQRIMSENNFGSDPGF